MTIIIFLKEKSSKILLLVQDCTASKTKLKQTAILNSSFYNIFISKRALHGHYASQKVNKTL